MKSIPPSGYTANKDMCVFEDVCVYVCTCVCAGAGVCTHNRVCVYVCLISLISAVSPSQLCTRRWVGQDRIYAPLMAVYLVISLPKIPCMHRIYRVLANPKYMY